MSVSILLSGFDPGTYVIEDDGNPTNGIVQLRLPDGSTIPFSVPADFVRVTASAGRNVVINCAESFGTADVIVGNLADPGQNPDSITVLRVHTTGDVSLASNGAIVEGGNDAGADITAAQVTLSAQTGIGTGGNALETQTSVIEGETVTGGINLGNFGAVQIGGNSDQVDGLEVTTSGNLTFTNVGSILLAEETGAESVRGGASGNVTLIANGSDSDIISSTDRDAVTVPGGSLTIQAGRDVAFGIVGADYDNDVRANGNVTVNAGRDFVIDGFADLASDDFSNGTGGNVSITTGRSIHVRNIAGADGSIFANGDAGGDVILTTGANGAVIVDPALVLGVQPIASNSGDVVINADRLLINAASGIGASAGQVILRSATVGREFLLGSAGDAGFAVELSNAELGRIFTPNLTIGSDNGGNVTVLSAIAPTNAANLTLRSHEDVTVLGGITTTASVRFIAGNNVFHQAGTINTSSFAAYVDSNLLGGDGGIGGYGMLLGPIVANSALLNGGADADVLRGTESIEQIVHGNEGNDTIISSGEGTYFGDAGNDTIMAGLSSGLVDEVLDGGAGIDTLDTASYSGSYTINLATGSTGFDYESFVNFENVITGDGHDVVSGTSGSNAISTGAGNDTLSGLGGNDTLEGGSDQDLLDGGLGSDTLRGGIGDDQYVVNGQGDAVIEAAGQGVDTVFSSASYALASGTEVEVLRTTSQAATGAINLTGNGFSQTIYGNNGANVLSGGSFGDDVLAGFAGNDSYMINSQSDQVIEAAGGGTDTAFASVSYALANTEVEVLRTTSQAGTGAINLTGNGFSQTIYGNNGTNVLSGGGFGDDVLYGFAGSDSYMVNSQSDQVIETAGQGVDTVFASVSYGLAVAAEVEVLRTTSQAGTSAINLVGSNTAQTIVGNAGANTIDGRGGNDTLHGLGGADSFAFRTALGAGNVDTVADYSVADDRILLDDAVFAGLATGALAAGAFATGAAATQADDRIIYNSATGALLFDADGSGAGAAVQFATLSAGLAMTAAEFVVI